MLIHRNLVMMIDIDQSPVLCPHANKTNLHFNILASFWANSLLSLQSPFDSLCTAIEAHKKAAMTNLASLF